MDMVIRIVIGFAVLVAVMVLLKRLFKKPAARLLALFVGLAIILAVGSVVSSLEINDVKKNGVCVEATATQIVKVGKGEKGADIEYRTRFSYQYEDKSYEFVDSSGSQKYDKGDTVEAYLYPDDPETLYFDESYSIGWGLFLLAIGVGLYFMTRNRSEKEFSEIVDSIY